MAYMEQLQSGLKYLTAAGETGRRSLDGMLGPVNGAIGEITGAASELSDLPFIGPAVGAKVQRLMRGVNAAQAKVGAVVATYNKATRAASQIEERLGVLKEQAGKAATAINKIAG
ncbi:phage tail protein, partial [Pseudomonas lundensis]